MPELGGSLIQVTFFKGQVARGDVHISVLIAFVSGSQLTSLPEFSRRLIFALRPRQCQPELIMSFAALGVEAHRFLEFGDCFRYFPVAENRLAECQVGPRERGRDGDDFSQLLNLPCRTTVWAGTVSNGKIELGLDRGGLQCDSLLEFPNGFLAIRGGKGRSQIGVGVGVIGPETKSITKRSDGPCVIIGLCQYQPNIVVRVREVWT